MCVCVARGRTPGTRPRRCPGGSRAAGRSRLDGQAAFCYGHPQHLHGPLAPGRDLDGALLVLADLCAGTAGAGSARGGLRGAAATPPGQHPRRRVAAQRQGLGRAARGAKGGRALSLSTEGKVSARFQVPSSWASSHLRAAQHITSQHDAARFGSSNRCGDGDVAAAAAARQRRRRLQPAPPLPLARASVRRRSGQRRLTCSLRST